MEDKGIYKKYLKKLKIEKPIPEWNLAGVFVNDRKKMPGN